jgi:hypothetical protein
MHFLYVTRGTRLSQEGTILLWKLALSHRVSSNHAPKASRIRVREENRLDPAETLQQPYPFSV